MFLAHDLLKHYDCISIFPRMCLKIDLKKVFDSISLDFIQEALKYFHFPPMLINHIMTCISSPFYLIFVHGAPFEYFVGNKGLRQGDLLSPFVFVICMKFLSKLLHENFDVQHLHPACHSTKLNHLFFAVDLLVFAEGKLQARLAIQQYLEDFTLLFDLHINKEKYELFFGGVSHDVKGYAS